MSNGISDVNSEEYKALERKARWEEITQLRDSAVSWIKAIDRLKAYGSIFCFMLGLVPFRVLGENYVVLSLGLSFVLSITWYLRIPVFCKKQSQKATILADQKEKKFREQYMQ